MAKIMIDGKIISFEDAINGRHYIELPDGLRLVYSNNGYEGYYDPKLGDDGSGSEASYGGCEMNVVFLDYDGVVNTPMWDDTGTYWEYGSPFKEKVNNWQNVQWLSEFCEKYHYSIVVTSSWRIYDNYIDCLVNGGLRKGIKVVGKTPRFYNKSRGFEIAKFLASHPEIRNFIILDDEDDMDELKDHLVLCDSSVGFGIREFDRACKLHEQFNNNGWRGLDE